jgi:pimeloyl-ACP methyl ester carboxylesterase
MRFIKKTGLLILLALAAVGFAFYHSDVPVATLKAKYAYGDSQFMDLDGLTVHYRVVGSGKPVILLHGTGASLHTWEAFANQLKDSFQLISLDLPAFGLTGARADHDYSMEMYVSFLKKFTEKLNLAEFDLAGNSLGGRIAWEFAATYPDQIRRLVLMDAAGYPTGKPMPQVFRLAQNPIMGAILTKITPRFFIKNNLMEVYDNDSLVSDALVDRVFDMSLREGNRQAFVDRTNLPLHDNSERVKTIADSTLIIWGENDAWIPVSSAQSFHKDLKNSQLAIIKNCGHLPMEERPVETAGLVKAFLRQ